MNEYNPRKQFDKIYCNAKQNERKCEHAYCIPVGEKYFKCYSEYLEQLVKQMLEALTQVNELIQYTGNYKSVKYICRNAFAAITKQSEVGK